MNYKKTINIFLRCAIYVYILSRMFNVCVNVGLFSLISFFKVIFDLFLVDFFLSSMTNVPDDVSNNLASLIISLNIFFFTYFYAKLCGLYKLFKNYKFWQKFLIFSFLTILIFPVAMFDFKNFKIFDNFFIDNNSLTTIYTSIFVLPAFFLNLFFNFLTKKFPKPFEKIGYIFSIELFKNLFKRKSNS